MRGLMQDYPLTIDAIFRHVEQHYGADPNRVYASGASGGGRCASTLAFGFPELITGGGYPIIGINFYRRVEVGPARRTAAAIEAAARAQRQREAEREIDSDPFVRSLIRDFGASIVPGSIRPILPDTGAAAH